MGSRDQTGGWGGLRGLVGGSVSCALHPARASTARYVPAVCSRSTRTAPMRLPLVGGLLRVFVSYINYVQVIRGYLQVGFYNQVMFLYSACTINR